MGLKKSVIESLNSNSTEFHLYIHEAHANASDSNSGLDPDFPLATWAAAELKTPLDTRAHLFWHMGPHSGAGYELTPCRKRVLRGCNWYIMGDGGGDDTLARNVLDTGVVSSSDDNGSFVPVDEPVAHAWKGKSLRWTSGPNSGPGFNQQIRTITSQDGPDGGVIILAAPTEFGISATDTFEVFTSTTTLLLPALPNLDLTFEDLEPLFNETGFTPTFSPLEIGAAPTPNYLIQDHSRSRIYLVNVNLTGAVSAGDSHFLVIRESALCMHGVTNAPDLGDVNGTSYQGFYEGGDIVMGYDNIRNFEEVYAQGALATGLATSETQWAGWGRGHSHGAIDADTPFLLCIGGNHRGYVASPSIVITDGRFCMYGNSFIEPGSVMGFGIAGLGGYIELFQGEADYLTIAGETPVSLETSVLFANNASLIGTGGDPVLELEDMSRAFWTDGSIVATDPNPEVVKLTGGSKIYFPSAPTIEDGDGATNVISVGGITGLKYNNQVSYQNNGCELAVNVDSGGGTIADYSDSATYQGVGNPTYDLLTYTTRANHRAISVSVTVFGLEASSGDSAKYVIEAVFHRDNAGVVTSKNVDIISNYQEEPAWGGVALVVSGQNIVVQVTGEIFKTIEWRGKMIVDEHGLGG